MVLENFPCSVSVILISNRGIAVFSEPAGWAFFTILNSIKYSSSSPPTFSKPFSVSDRKRVCRLFENMPINVTYFVYFI